MVAMSDDRPDQATSAPDSGRPKRVPPTIDLEATEVSTATADDDAGAAPPPDPEPIPQPAHRPAAASVFVIALVSGAVAAALVIGVGWVLGWPQVAPNPPAAPQVDAAAVEGLAGRIAKLEESGKIGHHFRYGDDYAARRAGEVACRAAR